MALIASTSTDVDSDVDSKDDDKVFSELTREELIIVVRYLIRNYESKTKSFMILKKKYELLYDKAKSLNSKIENLVMQNQILKEDQS